MQDTKTLLKEVQKPFCVQTEVTPHLAGVTCGVKYA